jgi:hypothetical protein
MMRNNPEDNHLHTRRRENLKSHQANGLLRKYSPTLTERPLDPSRSQHRSAHLLAYLRPSNRGIMDSEVIIIMIMIDDGYDDGDRKGDEFV